VAKSDPRRGAEHPSSLLEKKEAKKEKCFQTAALGRHLPLPQSGKGAI